MSDKYKLKDDEISTERKKSDILIANYFSIIGKNFKKLVGLNLIFAVPSALIIALFVGLSFLLSHNVNIFLCLLAVVGITPFFNAMCHVLVRVINGKRVELFKNFLYGLKDNLGTSLMNGLLFYGASVMVYAGVSLYGYLASKQGGIYIALLIINLLISMCVLFFFMSVNVMTVSIQLKPLQIYKNSLLAIFGELKNNLVSLVGMISFSALLTFLMMLIPSALIKMIVALILFLLIIPVSFTLIYFNILYKSIITIIGTESEEAKREAEKKKELSINPDDLQSLEDDINSSKNDDEYVFYNGKMIKRSKMRELIKKEQELNNQDTDNTK